MMTKETERQAKTGISKTQADCSARQQLWEVLLNATSDLFFLEREQLRAALDGTIAPERFGTPLQNAQSRKHQAQNAYLEHIEQHGCWE